MRTKTSHGWFSLAVLCAALLVVTVRFAQPVASAFAAHRQRAHRHKAAGAKRPAAPKTLPTEEPTPVLVELFTSEGCSSCPPADSLLGRLETEQPVPAADVLALEEHVDYWDSPAWRDRFSSHQFSARQNVYMDRLLLPAEYTPQMIVDGKEELVGSDVVHALHAIAQAASKPKLPLKLSPIVLDGGRLAGEVSVPPSAMPTAGAHVFAAVVESPVATQVLGGENGGQTLKHVSVVREMRQIGTVARAERTPLKFLLDVPDDAASHNLRIVVFVQRAGQGAVLGAVAASPAVNNTPVTVAAAIGMAGQ